MISVNVQVNGPLNATLLLLLCPFVGRAFARTQHNLLMLVAMASQQQLEVLVISIRVRRHEGQNLHSDGDNCNYSCIR